MSLEQAVAGVLSKPQRKVYPGLYPGVVVNNIDPKKQGRLQVRIDGVYGTNQGERIVESELPFARPCFPVTGPRSAEIFVPPIGAGVWVQFWKGDPEWPVWMGCYLPTPDLPAEFATSYSPDPKTRLVKNQGQQRFEMRWVPGQEAIDIEGATGVRISLVEAGALGGPKVEMEAPGNRKITIDSLQQILTIETPTGKIEINDSLQTIEIDATTATVGLDGSVGSVDVAAVGAVTIAAAAAASIEAASVAINTTGGNSTSDIQGNSVVDVTGTVTINVSGIYTLSGPDIRIGNTTLRRLIDERFAALFDAHSHSGPGTPPIPLMTPVLATVATSQLTAA